MTAQIAVSVALAMFSALLSFFIWYLRGTKSGLEKALDDARKGFSDGLSGVKASLEKDLARQDREIQRINKTLNEMPQVYVFRDDFVRWSISIDHKIDDLAKDIKSLIEKGGNACSP